MSVLCNGYRCYKSEIMWFLFLYKFALSYLKIFLFESLLTIQSSTSILIFIHNENRIEQKHTKRLNIKTLIRKLYTSGLRGMLYRSGVCSYDSCIIDKLLWMNVSISSASFTYYSICWLNSSVVKEGEKESDDLCFILMQQPTYQSFRSAYRVC